jgi:hypothetical protein
MEIKIKFDLLNDLLNNIVEAKRDFDLFKNEMTENYKKLKQVADDLNSLIIIILIGDGFL